MSLLQFLSAFACISTVSALYFHIGETEKKCFIEEIPDETMVVGMFDAVFCDSIVKTSVDLSFLLNSSDICLRLKICCRYLVRK